MRFHLVYSGPLSASGNKSKPEEVATIPDKLHSQLKFLWQNSNTLWRLRHTARVPGEQEGEKFGSAQPQSPLYIRWEYSAYEPLLPGWVDLCEPLPHHGRSYIPLIRSSLDLNCHLDILFLRQFAKVLEDIRKVQIFKYRITHCMSGTKGRSGGAREGSGPKPKPKSDVVDALSLKPRGHPVGVPGGGHDGRQPGAVDKQLNPARIIPMADKWNFAETALSHAERMLEILVNLAETAQSEGVRMTAADKVIDRAIGKAPQHFDISAKRHTDIVYRSAEELRAFILYLNI